MNAVHPRKNNNNSGARMVEHNANGFKEVIKCVVVGDSGVGKTCLICAHACGTNYDLRKLVKTHQATVFAIDTYQQDQEILERSWCDVDGCQVSLQLWDTFGHHEKNRSFAYRGADVIVLCFSVMRPTTLNNVHRIWNVEISRHASNVPVILCGTQADLRYLCYDDYYLNIEKGLLYRDISPSDIITPSVGREVAKDIGAPYYETSVLTRFGISEVFINAARAALIDRQKMKFLNPQLRKIQKPLVQPPMKMPIPSFRRTEIAQPHTQSDISLLMNKRFECDVTFLVQNHSFDAHRICLVVASNFFKDLFSVESLAKLQTKRRRNSQLRKQFPNRFGHTDLEHLLDSDQESLSTDTDCGSFLQESAGESFLTGTKPLSRFPLSIPYDHEAIDNIEIRPEEEGSQRLLTFITLNTDITVEAFRVVLDYLYCGRLNLHNVEPEKLRRTSEMLQLRDLMMLIDNMILHHEFLNIEIEQQLHCERIERMKELIDGPDFLTDITFQVDNGVVSAHKALLMVRCEMMYAMFSNDFIESASDIIPFPGITCETFKVLQEYLYTGSFSSLDGVDCIALIEVANRLCLMELVNMVESKVISELLTYDNKDQMLKDVITLLEPTELYNANQLSRFCKYTLCINFDDAIQKQHKLLKTLPQEKQDDIEKRRWPPDWYFKEVDLYEKQVQNSATQFAAQEYRPKRGCLCFCSRRGKHVLTDPVELPA